MIEEMFSSSWVPTAILNARLACASEAAAFSPIIIARLSWDLTSSKVVHLSMRRLWTTTCCILAWRDQEAPAGSVWARLSPGTGGLLLRPCPTTPRLSKGTSPCISSPTLSSGTALGPSPSRPPERKEASLRLLDLSRDIRSIAKGKFSMNIAHSGIQCRWLSLVAHRDSK